MEADITCFVIGPIGDRLAPSGSSEKNVFEQALMVYEDVIVSACEAHQIRPTRADQIAVAGTITEQVFRHIREDDLVIADISGGNPNVMYELGLRHSTGKPTIQLCEYGELPFDVKNVRTIQFSRSEKGLIVARKDLEASIPASLLDGSGPLVAASLWPDPTGSVRPGDAHIVEDAPEGTPEDEPAFFDLMVVIAEGFPSLTAVMESISETVEAIGAQTEASTADISQVPEAATPRERLNAIGRFASAISSPVEQLDEQTQDFETKIKELDQAIMGLSVFASQHPDVWDEAQVREFAEMVAELASTGRESMEGVNAFGVAAEGLGAISKLLRVPGRRIKDATERLQEAVGLMDRWDVAFSRLLADS